MLSPSWRLVGCTVAFPVILSGLLGGSGCSSQDFTRPVGRIADVLDSKRPYVTSDDEEMARQRAERLAQVLLAWDREQEGRRRDYPTGPEDVLDIGILALEEPGKVARLERRIGKDGLITLPFVGEVRVGGLTSREIEHLIAAAYSAKHLKNPQVSVRVAQYRSAPVVVTGMVNKPSVYYLKENESSVLEILSEAGGLHPNAGDVLHIIRGRSVESIPAGESVSSPRTSAAVPPDELEGATHRIPDSSSPLHPSAGAGVHSDVAAPAETAGGGTGAVSVSEGPRPSPSRARRWSRRRTTVTQVPSAAAIPEPAGDTVASAHGGGGASGDLPGNASPAAGLPAAREEGSRQFPGETAVAPDVLTVDLKRLLDEGDIRLNVPVQGGDLVSVPPAKRRYVYILGYVKAPGQYELRDQTEISALHAVALAGGLAPAARAENSLLIRETASGRKITPVDLTKIVRGVRPTLYLKSGDTLIIGSGFFARLAEFIKPTAAVGASATLNPVP